VVTDAELVERTLAGSEDGFRTLVVRHQRGVYNLLARMLRNPSVAEELTQDTFLKAYSGLGSFDPIYKFSNWILRIAHNTAIDSLRRRGPREVSLDEPASHDSGKLGDALVDPSSDNAIRRVEQRDVSRSLNAALDHLRPEYRRMVVLRYQQELTYEEITEITGLPLGTVKSYLHRARAEMAAFLRQNGLVQPGPDDVRRKGQERAV
jgi:RNA polymerase sigma-70 factor (ECF subfamily)